MTKIRRLGAALGLALVKERDVLAMRHGLHAGPERMTLREVGAVYGVRRERIRQIQWKALRKIEKGVLR